MKRPRKPNVEQVSELVRFAEDDFGRASSRRFLMKLLHTGDMVSLGDAESELGNWPSSKLAMFHRELRLFLRAIVKLGENDNSGSLIPVVAIGRLEFAPVAVGEHLLLGFDASARDALWLQTMEMLRRFGLQRIRACPDSACSKLFVRTGRQDYCSDKCQARIYMRGRRAEGYL
jgi:hypothetical protein